MLRSIGTLLLLLQLRPIAGAAICLHQSLATDQACEMAMPGTENQKGIAPHSPSSSAPKPSSDCPLAPLCAIPAGAVLSVQSGTSIATVEVIATVPVYLNTLLATDPAAPLVPPPNA